MTHKPVLKDRKQGYRKLALSKETLRDLTTRDLGGIFGGSDSESELATRTRLCSEDLPAGLPRVTPFKK